MRFLQISIGVMTRDEKIESIIKDNDPRIRNDLLLILGNQNYETVSKIEGKEELRKRCLESVRTVVADSGGEGRQGRGAVLHFLRDAVGRAHGRSGSSQPG